MRVLITSPARSWKLKCWILFCLNCVCICAQKIKPKCIFNFIILFRFSSHPIQDSRQRIVWLMRQNWKKEIKRRTRNNGRSLTAAVHGFSDPFLSQPPRNTTLSITAKHGSSAAENGLPLPHEDPSCSFTQLLGNLKGKKMKFKLKTMEKKRRRNGALRRTYLFNLACSLIASEQEMNFWEIWELGNCECGLIWVLADGWIWLEWNFIWFKWCCANTYSVSRYWFHTTVFYLAILAHGFSVFDILNLKCNGYKSVA